jgi:thymidylate synthase
MNKADWYYLNNLATIKEYGCWDQDPRPKWSDGTPAHSKFITQVFETYNIKNGEFPIPTLRNTAVKTGIREMFWIYQKQSNSLEVARELGINWWDEWDIGDGTIGSRYGETVRRWDLMNTLLDGLVNDPFGRRHILNMYQQFDLNLSKGLNPCAYETLWSVRSIGDELYLDMTLLQRSNDYVTAGAINKIQYVALLMMIAGHCGYKVGTFVHLTQNLHVYDRHMDALDELLSRTPLDIQPKLILNENKNFYDYTIDDFTITGINGIQPLSTKLEIAI